MELLDSHYQNAIANQVRGILDEQSELTLIAALKPAITRDGNMWCALYGDNLQDGIAGFGKSPRLAVLDFNRAWYAEIPA